MAENNARILLKIFEEDFPGQESLTPKSISIKARKRGLETDDINEALEFAITKGWMIFNNGMYRLKN